MITITDEELIEGCVAANKRSQQELYTRYANRMWGVCLRYARNREEAEDILQEGFIKVFDNISKFRNEGSFEGWIRRIMVNTALKHYSRNTFREESLGADEHLAGSIPAEAISRLSEKDLLCLIASLPEGYRLVFNMYVIEGYDHREIASMLGIAESTSRSQLVKARIMLQKQINSKNNDRKFIFLLMAADPKPVDELIREKLVNYSPEAPADIWNKINSQQNFAGRLKQLLGQNGITMIVTAISVVMVSAVCYAFLPGDKAFASSGNNNQNPSLYAGNAAANGNDNAASNDHKNDSSNSDLPIDNSASAGNNNSDKDKPVSTASPGSPSHSSRSDKGKKSPGINKQQEGTGQNMNDYSLKKRRKNSFVTNTSYNPVSQTGEKKVSVKSTMSVNKVNGTSTQSVKEEAKNKTHEEAFTPLYTSAFGYMANDLVTPPLPGVTVDEAFELAAEPSHYRFPKWYDKLSVRFEGSPVIMKRSLSANSPVYSDYEDAMRASEKMRTGFTAGAQFELELSDKWSLRTGVMFTQIKSDFEYDSNRQFSYTFDSVYTTYIVDPFNAPAPVVHHSIVTHTEHIYDTTRAVNVYSSINVPVLAKYSYTFKKLELHAAAGAVVNVSLNSEGIILNDSLSAAGYASIKQGRKTSLGWYTGLGLDYALTDRVGVTVEPHINYSVLGTDEHLKKSIRSYGVFTGITYKF